MDDEALRTFVSGRMREFGGSDLLSRVQIRCMDGCVAVECDRDAEAVVHGALFFCGEYGSVRCRFELVWE